MANRYWNPSADKNWGDANVWATTDGGNPTGVATPTNSDDVFFTGTNVYNCTIAADAIAKSITATGYTGIIASNVSKIRQLTLYGNVTTTGTFTIYGNSAINRLLVLSSAAGTPRTISAGTIVTKWVDWQDITAGGAANWNLTLQATDSSGDCGGNTGITFTTPVAQTWNNTNGGNWSDSANWTSATPRVPLPQDDVSMNDVFGTSKTVTADMPRLGKSIDWTGATWTTALTWDNSMTVSMFGSLKMITGITPSTIRIIFGGRDSYNLTSAGLNFDSALMLNAPTGTLTLLDDLVMTAQISILAGTFNDGNKNITASSVFSNTSLTRTITMGTTNTWTINGITAGATWFMISGTLTINANTSTIKITNSTNSNTSFAGLGKVYHNIYFSRGASTGNITITGSNTFNDFKDDGTAAHSIIFPNSTTTVTTFTVNGTNPNLISLTRTGASGNWTLSASTGTISCNYIQPSNSIATGGATWNAYTADGSVDGGGNTGWNFTVPITINGNMLEVF